MTKMKPKSRWIKNYEIVESEDEKQMITKIVSNAKDLNVKRKTLWFIRHVLEESLSSTNEIEDGEILEKTLPYEMEDGEIFSSHEDFENEPIFKGKEMTNTECEKVHKRSGNSAEFSSADNAFHGSTKKPRHDCSVNYGHNYLIAMRTNHQNISKYHSRYHHLQQRQRNDGSIQYIKSYNQSA